MTRHLQECGPKDPGSPPASDFHVFVEGRFNRAYWMHLSVPAATPLFHLDEFLRDIWLECCGHLSAFRILGREYDSPGGEELEESGMEIQMNRILEPGMSFGYEYDFGSTTELSLQILGLRGRMGERSGIELLARNDPPQILCDKCGNKLATKICTECDCQGKGRFCDPCAARHRCGEEMLLPVVNSPRAGVCGYAG